VDIIGAVCNMYRMSNPGPSPRFSTTLPEPYASALVRLCDDKRRTAPDMVRLLLIDALTERGLVKACDAEGAAEDGVGQTLLASQG
jgi:hypothetical protein